MTEIALLHGHSDGSIRDACAGIEEICKAAANKNVAHIAVTDHGTMCGVFDLHRTAKKYNVHPVLGVEAYVCDDKLSHTAADKSTNHITLLAQNNTGLKNLFKITSDAARHFYYRPRTDWKFIADHSDGVFLLSGCLKGKLNSSILAKTDYLSHVDFLRQTFKDNFAFEIQVNNLEEQRQCNEVLIGLSKQYGVRLVLTNDFHYISDADREPHRMLKYIDFIKAKSKDKVDFCDFQGYRSVGHYITSYDELKSLWIAHHGCFGMEPFEAGVANALQIASECNVQLDSSFKMVKFPVPEGFVTLDDYFKHVIKLGWQKRLPSFDPTFTVEHYKERLMKEIDVIRKMNFIDYFLMVSDFIQWAKSNMIYINLGRGSAAGSLLSWILGITEVDSLKYNLSFERFLNQDRIKMPDIDVDVSKNRRQEVIQYLKDKWGHDKVAGVSTYHRFTANSLFREIARCLKIPYTEANVLAKTIAEDLSWEENLKINESLRKCVEKYGKISQYMEVLDGKTRHVGLHAAAIIITTNPIDESVSLRKVDDDLAVEQEGASLEKENFIKNDVLGLNTLDILSDVAQKENLSMDDLYSLDGKDPKVYERFNIGDTVGVFQFSTHGMTALAKQVIVNSIADLADVNTMHRPAVLDAGIHTEYVARKFGQKDIQFLHPKFEKILARTYGLVIYQEQIIDIFVQLGLTPGEADIFRRDLELVSKGKKDYSVLEASINLAMSRGSGGFSKEEFEEITQSVLTQVGYLFNLSHSISYSMLGYICQWLKVYYPDSFFLALMNHEDKLDKIGPILDDYVNRFNYKVSYGNINSCHSLFTKIDNTVVIPLARAKGLSESDIENIAKFRPYESVMKFFASDLPWNKLNTKKIRALVELGIFNEIPLYDGGPVLNSVDMLQFYDMLRQYGQKKESNKYVTTDLSPKMMEVWQLVYDNMKLSAKVPFSHMTEVERKYYEFNCIYNPSVYIKKIFDKKKLMSVAPRNATEVHGGIISNVRHHLDKRKKKMAFVDFQTINGQSKNIVFFSSTWPVFEKKLLEGSAGVLYTITDETRDSEIGVGWQEIIVPDTV